MRQRHVVTGDAPLHRRQAIARKLGSTQDKARSPRMGCVSGVCVCVCVCVRVCVRVCVKCWCMRLRSPRSSALSPSLTRRRFCGVTTASRRSSCKVGGQWAAVSTGCGRPDSCGPVCTARLSTRAHAGRAVTCMPSQAIPEHTLSCVHHSQHTCPPPPLPPLPRRPLLPPLPRDVGGLVTAKPLPLPGRHPPASLRLPLSQPRASPCLTPGTGTYTLGSGIPLPRLPPPPPASPCPASPSPTCSAASCSGSSWNTSCMSSTASAITRPGPPAARV